MTKIPKELDSVASMLLAYKDSSAQDPSAPDGEFRGILNIRNDPRLTKSGGIDFHVWAYILAMDAIRCGAPTGVIESNDWREKDWRAFYDDDFTPHGALMEEFPAGGK